MILYFLTDNKKYEITKRDILRGKSVPHYAAFEPDGNGLMIVSYKSFTFVQLGQDLEESQDENMSEKIKGNFTLNLHRALSIFIYVSHSSSWLGFEFYQVKLDA